MTVEELIKMLSGYPSNAIIRLADSDGHSSYESTEIDGYEKDGKEYVMLS